MALSDGMLLLQTQLSVLLVGLLITAADVGLFRIAVSTAVVLSAPATIIAPVALPVISRLYAENDLARLQKLLTRSARVQFAAVLLLSLPLFLWPGPILALVYGHEYAAAADVLRIVLLGQLVTVGFGLNAALLNMTHHERRVTRAMAVGLLCNAVAIAALLPIWGVVGGAVGYASSMLAWNVLAWIDARRFVGVDTSVLSLRLSNLRPTSDLRE
jgi:O-antigen/teichoic acid export membrane protein